MNNPETLRPEIILRPADPHDAAALCDIRDRAWLEAYPNTELGISREQILLNAKGEHEVFVPKRIAYLQKEIADPESDKRFSVAMIGNKAVGMIAVETGAEQFILSLYVAPEHQQHGIGGKLMRHGLSQLDTARDIHLEVVSYNHNAIGFYEHFGFAKTDAAVAPEVGAPDYVRPLPQIEMVRPGDAA